MFIQTVYTNALQHFPYLIDVLNTYGLLKVSMYSKVALWVKELQVRSRLKFIESCKYAYKNVYKFEEPVVSYFVRN